MPKAKEESTKEEETPRRVPGVPLNAVLQRISEQRRQKIDKRVAEAISLAELRKNLNVSQRQLAAALGTSQPQISAIENGRDCYMSTFNDYVAALGGRVEINIRIGRESLPFEPMKIAN